MRDRNRLVTAEARLRKAIHEQLGALTRDLPSSFLLEQSVPTFLDRVGISLRRCEHYHSRLRLFSAFRSLAEFAKAEAIREHEDYVFGQKQQAATSTLCVVFSGQNRRYELRRVSHAFSLWAEFVRYQQQHEQNFAAKAIQSRWRQRATGNRGCSRLELPLGSDVSEASVKRLHVIAYHVLCKAALENERNKLVRQLTRAKAAVRIQSCVRSRLAQKVVAHRQDIKREQDGIYSAASRIQRNVRRRQGQAVVALRKSRMLSFRKEEQKRVSKRIHERVLNAIVIQKYTRGVLCRGAYRLAKNRSGAREDFLRIHRLYMLRVLKHFAAAFRRHVNQRQKERQVAAARRIQDAFRTYLNKRIFLLHRQQWEAQVRAATDVQRFWRVKLEEKRAAEREAVRKEQEFVAARRIQTQWRHYSAMRLLAAMIDRRQNAAGVIQFSARRFLYRLHCQREGELLFKKKEASAAQIQVVYREYSTAKRRLQGSKTLVIQCSYRQWASRKVVHRLKVQRQQEEDERRRRDAAMAIQCCFRQIQAICKARDRRHFIAARVLQSHWRGHIEITRFREKVRRRRQRNAKAMRSIQYDMVVRINIALRLQTNWRRKIAINVKKSLKSRQQRNAAIVIQCMGRRVLAQEQLYRMQTALTIQKSWRKSKRRRLLGGNIQERILLTRLKRVSAVRLQSWWRSHLEQTRYALRVKNEAKGLQMRLYRLERQRLAAVEEVKETSMNNAVREKAKRSKHLQQKEREKAVAASEDEAAAYCPQGWACNLPDIELLDWEIRKARVRHAWELRDNGQGSLVFYNTLLQTIQIQKPDDIYLEKEHPPSFDEHPEAETWIHCFKCSTTLTPLLTPSRSLAPDCTRAHVYCTCCESPFCNDCFEEIHKREERRNHPSVSLVDANFDRCSHCDLNLPVKRCNDCTICLCSRCFDRLHCDPEHASHAVETIKYVDPPNIGPGETICGHCNLVTASSCCLDCDDNFCDVCFAMTHRSRSRRKHVKAPYDRRKHWKEMYEKDTLTPYYKNIYTNEISIEKPDVLSEGGRRGKHQTPEMRARAARKKKLAKLREQVEALEQWKIGAEAILQREEQAEQYQPSKARSFSKQTSSVAQRSSRASVTGSRSSVQERAHEKSEAPKKHSSKWSVLVNNPTAVLKTSARNLVSTPTKGKRDTVDGGKGEASKRASSKWASLAKNPKAVITSSSSRPVSTPSQEKRNTNDAGKNVSKSQEKSQAGGRPSKLKQVVNNPGLVLKQAKDKRATTPVESEASGTDEKQTTSRKPSKWDMLRGNSALSSKQLLERSRSTGETGSTQKPPTGTDRKASSKWKMLAKDPTRIVKQAARSSSISSKKGEEPIDDAKARRISNWKFLANNAAAVVRQTRNSSVVTEGQMGKTGKPPMLKALASNINIITQQASRVPLQKSSREFLAEKAYIERMLVSDQAFEEMNNTGEEDEAYARDLLSEMSALRKQKQEEHVEEAKAKLLPDEFKKKYDQLWSRYSKAQNQVELSEKCKEAGIKYGAVHALDDDKLTKEEALKELVMYEHGREVTRKRIVEEQKAKAARGKHLQRRLEDLERLSAPKSNKKSALSIPLLG